MDQTSVGRWTRAALKTIARHKGDLSKVLLDLDCTRATLEGRIRRHGRSTLGKELKRAQFGKVKADLDEDAAERQEADLQLLQRRVKDLEKDLADSRKQTLTDEMVRREIFRAATAPVGTPTWAIETPKRSDSSPGVPILEISDEHWGEVVDPGQIGGVNAYDLSIARARLKALGENTLDLLMNHTVNPKYPGMVLSFLGDGTTGNIHDELMATNEEQIMPCVLDLRDHRVAFIDGLLKEIERLFIVCVIGNHGRDTPKVWAKVRAHTSFDWLGYQMLARHYEGNKRVQFLIPDGTDALFQVYGHRYLATHGNDFRGGDGIIGAIGPIFRGDAKKRARNGQIGMGYDTMLCGHFHQRIALQRLIVNGSLKGYDEYASVNNFPFEPPQQNLWLSHPQFGPTIAMPVFVERKRHKPTQGWVQWAA